MLYFPIVRSCFICLLYRVHVGSMICFVFLLYRFYRYNSFIALQTQPILLTGSHLTQDRTYTPLIDTALQLLMLVKCYLFMYPLFRDRTKSTCNYLIKQFKSFEVWKLYVYDLCCKCSELTLLWLLTSKDVGGVEIEIHEVHVRQDLEL